MLVYYKTDIVFTASKSNLFLSVYRKTTNLLQLTDKQSQVVSNFHTITAKMVPHAIQELGIFLNDTIQYLNFSFQSEIPDGQDKV